MFFMFLILNKEITQQRVQYCVTRETNESRVEGKCRCAAPLRKGAVRSVIFYFKKMAFLYERRRF